jgi:hypothetical protein
LGGAERPTVINGWPNNAAQRSAVQQQRAGPLPEKYMRDLGLELDEWLDGTESRQET